MSWADVEFENDDKAMAEPNYDREELELEDVNARRSDARFVTPDGNPQYADSLEKSIEKTHQRPEGLTTRTWKQTMTQVF